MIDAVLLPHLMVLLIAFCVVGGCWLLLSILWVAIQVFRGR